MSIHGFDPLSAAIANSSDLEGILEHQAKRSVESILKSYTGFYDVFSELAQNAIDALETRAETDKTHQPKLWILIDIKNSKIRFVDNGVGMDSNTFKFCLAPSVSFKPIGKLRGQKGVGASFLAYGYTFLKVQSKKHGTTNAAIIRQGRNWAEDTSGTIPRPRLEEIKFDVSELANEPSGTAFEIIVGKNAGERPRDLGWIGATTAAQWFDVLRIKTPIGGIYLDKNEFGFQVELRVVAADGTQTVHTAQASEYYYPHEMPDQKCQTISAIATALSKIDGDAQTKFSKLAPEHKRLDCVWDVWTHDQIVAPDSVFESTLDEASRELVLKHRVSVYAAFLRSARLWTQFNEETLRLRKQTRVIQGGLQMASDGMAQGDLFVIPLTSAIGYQANSHVIVHFHNGSPDMGRKVFQPELKQLADSLAVRAVNTMKRFLQNMKPDTGTTNSSPTKELYEWKKAQENFRNSNPLSFVFDGKQLAFTSEPQQEQDVVALFHELIGLGVIRGLKILATSSHDRYDSLVMAEYDNAKSFSFSKSKNPLGVHIDKASKYISEPRVLEYKFDFDALIEDFDKETKFEDQVDLLVCWSVGKKFLEKYYLNSLLVDDEGTGREFFGSTHQVYRDGQQKPVFELVVLEDLLNFLQKPDEEIARQRQKYRD